MVFCQKILTREEFSRFCDGMREISIYSRETNTSTDRTRNRLIVTPDALEVYPDFAEKYSFIDVLCGVSWDAHAIGKGLPLSGIGEVLVELNALNLDSAYVCIGLNMGKIRVKVSLGWDVSTGDPIPSWGSVNLKLNDSDDYYGRSLVKNLEPGFSPRGFPKSILVEKLSFLRGLRLRPGEYGVAIESEYVNIFWKLFTNWYNDGKNDFVSGATVAFVLRKTDQTRWVSKVVRDIITRTGGDEACLDLSLGFGNAKGNTDFEQEYHQWLAKIVGLRTLSGSAARYVVGAICTGGYGGEIWSYFVPEGVCLGYIEYDRRPKTAPKELSALLPGVEWIRGMPPGGDSFPFPIYGVDEHNDPLPGVDVKAAIKDLRSVVKKWKARKTLSAPGSLEEQIEKLAEVDLKLHDAHDIDDLLDYREREWYEDTPYIHLLARMGMLKSFGRMCYVDFDQVTEELSLLELLRKFDIGGVVKTDQEGKFIEVNATGKRRVVAFPTFEGKEFRWEFDHPVKRVTPEFLRKYDSLLHEQTSPYRKGRRLYSIAIGDPL